MKLIRLLNKRLRPGGTAGKVTGIAVSLVFALSLMLFGMFFLKMNIITAAALFALIAAPYIFFGLYRVMYNNTVFLHLCCAGLGVYCSVLISEIAADDSDAGRVITAVSAALVFFGFSELTAGVIMNFSGDETRPEAFPQAMLSVLPLFFTVFIFIPSETYFGNYEEFKFLYTDFVPYFIVKTVLFTLAAAVILCGLSRKAFTAVTRVIAGLTICVYAQYMFMNGILPSALGDTVEWEEHTADIAVNAVIWVILLMLPTAAGTVTDRIKALKDNNTALSAHNYLSMFLGGVQLVTLVTLILTADADTFTNGYVSLSNREQFTVSRGRNIITFIIDMADRDYFDKAYEEHPEKFACLKDFTYYTNACMMYDSTYLSIPQMLTASEILPEYSQNEWLETIWGSETSETFYSRLRDNNYTINIYGDFAYEYSPLVGRADNTYYVTRGEMENDIALLYSSLDDISAYRWMPTGLKRYFEYGAFQCRNAVVIPNACVHDNREFLSKLDLTLSDSGKDYFIVEHIIGTHGFTDLIPVETLDCLDILNEYIRQLKELGVYDNSAIIITADHGEHTKADNTPVWYMKRVNETHSEMRYSSAPIHHSDFAATCLSEAGLLRPEDEAMFGRPVSDIAEDEERTRLIFQRFGFRYVGPVDWKIYSDAYHDGALFGYYFTGDREDLKRHEENDPPDVLIELDGAY